jgi:hypothetical protein
MVQKGRKLWRTNRREEDETWSFLKKTIGKARGTYSRKP